MMEQLELFDGVDIPPLNPNEMVRIFGKGPQGAKCRTCKYLKRKTRGRTYFKCQYRSDTNGPGTDHRAGWDACALYKERDETMEWVDQMKQKIDETYPEEKWRKYFYSIVDSSVKYGLTKRETARRVLWHMNVIHALFPDIKFNKVKKEAAE